MPLSDDLVHAAELLNQAETNNARSLRKAYLQEAKKHLARAKSNFPIDDPEAQAGIRQIEFHIIEIEYQFPEIVKSDHGLGELSCPVRHCPIKTCRAEIPEGSQHCPVCGAKVTLVSVFGDLQGIFFKGDWLFITIIGLTIFLWFKKMPRKKR